MFDGHSIPDDFFNNDRSTVPDLTISFGWAMALTVGVAVIVLVMVVAIDSVAPGAFETPSGPALFPC